MKYFTSKEIKSATLKIELEKVSRSDGLLACFYEKLLELHGLNYMEGGRGHKKKKEFGQRHE